MDLTNKSELIHYLQSHGLYTQKKLGQNFLVDRVALEKIVAAAEISKDDLIIEVGSGLGTLTEELVEHAGKVAAVELDTKLADLLYRRISNDKFLIPNKIPNQQMTKSDIKKLGFDLTLEISNLELIRQLRILNKDILKVDLTEIVGTSSYKVVANIPYYITSKILRFFLEQKNKPSEIVLLTQKEVAERICAKPGDMSVLAISVQAYGEPEIIDIVKRDSFFPAPEVDSAILRIKNIRPYMCHSRENGNLIKDPRVKPEDDKEGSVRVDGLSEKTFFRCIHIGFASRRKTLLNNLSAGYHLEKPAVLDILKKAGLTEKSRAQELSLTQWQSLSSIIKTDLGRVYD